jgi:hypothetical protein
MGSSIWMNNLRRAVGSTIYVSLEFSQSLIYDNKIKTKTIFYILYYNTFCQTIAGPLLSKFSASHGIVMLSPSLRKYNTFGTTISFGGCWTITSIGVDGPSVPKSLNGVHVYLPPCSFSTYMHIQYA